MRKWYKRYPTDRPQFFFCEAMCKQLNEDETQLIPMYIYTNGAITETEKGHLSE